jgi:hypothetical protein
VIAEKHDEFDEDRMMRGRMVGTLARLARRPWKKGTDLDSMQTVINIRSLSQNSVKRLTRMAFENLDTTSRGIAVHNVKLALAVRPDVLFTTWRVSSVVLSSENCKSAMLSSLKFWANDWKQRAGIMVVVEVAAFEKAAQSILTILDTTKIKGKLAWDATR